MKVSVRTWTYLNLKSTPIGIRILIMIVMGMIDELYLGIEIDWINLKYPAGMDIEKGFGAPLDTTGAYNDWNHKLEGNQ